MELGAVHMPATGEMFLASGDGPLWWNGQALPRLKPLLAAGEEAIDREARFPRETVARMGELGLLGVAVPEAFGGSGGDTIDPGSVIGPGMQFQGFSAFEKTGSGTWTLTGNPPGQASPWTISQGTLAIAAKITGSAPLSRARISGVTSGIV